MEPEFDLRTYLAILRRRFLFLLFPAALICVAGVAVAYMLPRVYEASATILVESQEIPTNLASPTVTANASERLKVIEQRLMARDNLLQVANKFNLYDYEGENRSPTTIVNSMRNSINIKQIDVGNRAARRDIGVIGFTVTFEYRDANTASRVTNELVQTILSQNIETRLSRASETSKFFEQQLKELEKRLLQTESRIAEFKRKNQAALPETLSTRRVQFIQFTTQIADLDQKIRLASNPAAPSSASQANLKQLNYRLDAKKIELKSFQEQREELAPLAEKGFVTKKRISDLDRQIAVAELDIASINSQIEALPAVQTGEEGIKLLQTQRDELAKQAAELNENILKTPVVEVELNALTRDYENLQTEYRQAQSKFEDAQTGERLEQDRQAERFEVIDQATTPSEPTKPNRPKIIMAGSFGGMAVGFGLVVLLELLDNSIRTISDLEKRLQLRPIAVIPYVVTTGEQRRRRWRLLALGAAIIGMIVALLAAIHFYYLPLDLFADQLWQKLEGLLPIGG